MPIPENDKSAIVVPFGKHKGRTVAELLTHDPSYAEWITNQGWVAERFAELHAAIPCRWCVGESQKPGCVACKGTGTMWVGT